MAGFLSGRIIDIAAGKNLHHPTLRKTALTKTACPKASRWTICLRGQELNLWPSGY